MSRPYVRRASHAGSWYSDTASDLNVQLRDWMLEYGPPIANMKALISPHAGYSYAGQTAAAAYRHVDPQRIKRVFILGPSHHINLRKCAISGASQLETPLGNLQVDLATRDALLGTGLYEVTTQAVDEDEHSIEMQLPYLALLFCNNPDITIVPIMIGSIDQKAAGRYTESLHPFFDDNETLFIISSDFCHWGKRFGYTPYDPTKGEIHEYIKWLDREGMSQIQAHNVHGFTAYLEEYRNTICGRNPITILLSLIQASSKSYCTEFVKYAQSSAALNLRDSSVSYAAAVVKQK